MTMTDYDDYDHEFDDMSAGALRVMRQHVLKSLDRIQRATDRADVDDPAAEEMLQRTDMDPMNCLADAYVRLYQCRNGIENELDGRDEPYEK